jgi:N-acetylmuramoyl-L-alanine amidase
MISIFERKDDLKIRQGVLRGVYEENLLILGRVRPPLSRRRPFPLRRILLYTAAFLFLFLMHGQFMGTSFSPPELTANMSTNPLPVPTADVSSQSTVKPPEFSDFMSNGNVPLSRMLGLRIRRITIDAGHGGIDSGSVGKMGTMEKDITLDIAKRLKAHLIKGGRYHVHMTREDDSSVSLEKRVALAREVKSDLFISIHVNSLPKKPLNIIETYYFGPSDDEKTLRLAEKENAGSEHGLSDFREVVEMLSKTMKFQESKELAESIQANLFLNSRKHSEDIKNYGVKRAPFVVLLGADVPAVLAEVSCLSNQEEERELNSEIHRENIAGYLATGIFNYLNKGVLKNEAKR